MGSIKFAPLGFFHSIDGDGGCPQGCSLRIWKSTNRTVTNHTHVNEYFLRPSETEVSFRLIGLLIRVFLSAIHIHH